jgi:hypothetical protein
MSLLFLIRYYVVVLFDVTALALLYFITAFFFFYFLWKLATYMIYQQRLYEFSVQLLSFFSMNTEYLIRESTSSPIVGMWYVVIYLLFLKYRFFVKKIAIITSYRYKI